MSCNELKTKWLENTAPNEDNTKTVDDPKEIIEKEGDKRVVSWKRSLQTVLNGKKLDKDSNVPGQNNEFNWFVLAEALVYVVSGWQLGAGLPTDRRPHDS